MRKSLVIISIVFVALLLTVARFIYVNEREVLTQGDIENTEYKSIRWKAGAVLENGSLKEYGAGDTVSNTSIKDYIFSDLDHDNVLDALVVITSETHSDMYETADSDYLFFVQKKNKEVVTQAVEIPVDRNIVSIDDVSVTDSGLVQLDLTVSTISSRNWTKETHLFEYRQNELISYK
ncbi:MAG: hypothetical protein WC761_03800 [Candidatus Paceibacterota bacterium]|jgi:hypothetical protein